jgi:hypothetical protein
VIGHDDPRHGTNRGYLAGCHEACCRAAHAAEQRAYRAEGRPRLVAAAPTVRRIEALACRGWSQRALAARLGRARSYLQHVVHRDLVWRTTAAKVAVLFDELCDVDRLDAIGNRVRAEATARGAVPPWGWVDIETGAYAVSHIPEKPCCCPLETPDEATDDGLVCVGCGWCWAWLAGRCA